ncbi:hypothetical protein GGF37_007196, partial [Kickxella alabastrina]
HQHQQQSTFRVLPRQLELPDAKGAFGIPQVMASSEANKPPIRMFDAIQEDTSTGHTGPQGAAEPTVDDLVPMVRDYLSFDQRPVPEYVYDFYYVQQQQQEGGLRALSNSVGMATWIDDVEELLDVASDVDDDEDSNAEDYYANEYPDNPDSASDYYYSTDEREDIESEREAWDDGREYEW